MNKNNMLSSIDINPSSPADMSIIWLHGLGADANDFTPIIPELKLPKSHGVRFIFPNAPVRPVTINNGYEMRAWYDITSISSERTTDVTGITQSVQAIEALIQRETEEGIPSRRIILAGFSQGAAIALTTFINYPQPLAGVIALSGYLPLQQAVLQQAQPINKQSPLFIAHGSEDTVVPYALGKAAYAGLKETGFDPQWHSYPMGHSVCQEEIRDIGEFIGQLNH